MSGINKRKIAKIFNEWAKRYAENPDEFHEILDSDGLPFKSYSDQCAEYFEKLNAELE